MRAGASRGGELAAVASLEGPRCSNCRTPRRAGHVLFGMAPGRKFPLRRSRLSMSTSGKSSGRSIRAGPFRAMRRRWLGHAGCCARRTGSSPKWTTVGGGAWCFCRSARRRVSIDCHFSRSAAPLWMIPLQNLSPARWAYMAEIASGERLSSSRILRNSTAYLRMSRTAKSGLIFRRFASSCSENSTSIESKRRTFETPPLGGFEV